MAVNWDDIKPRRLPIYIVVDTSGSMAGAKIAAVNAGLESLRQALLSDPRSVETSYISLITFSDVATQTPLTPVTHFEPPQLMAGGATALGAALHQLNDSLDHDLVPNSPERKGDYRPLVFLMTDGAPTDTWEPEVQRLKSRTQATAAAVVALAIGADADIKLLQQIASTVIETGTGEMEGLKAFFQWASSSIKIASRTAPAIAAGQEPQIPLPPLPSGLMVDLAPEIVSLPPTSPQPTREEETESAPPPKTADEERTIVTAPAPPPPPAWDADEIVRGWDDTPTILAPRGGETHAAESVPPPPPAPPAPAAAPQPASQPQPTAPSLEPTRDGAAPETPDVTRGGGSWQPSGAPVPSAPPPLGADIPDGAAAPGFGAPAGYPGYPGYPPASGYPGYPPAQSYPPYPPTQGYAPPPAYGAPPNPMAPAPQGGYGYPGPFSPWPAAPATPVAVAEQVMFTAYHVREIMPLAWEPLYVYIALDTPQAQAQVQAAAQQVLAGRMSEFRPATAAETSWLRRGTQLTFVPSVPGCVFNPPDQTIAWQADVQQLAFSMQAATARPGFAANGSIQVFTGPLLRADIPISVFVRQPGAYQQPPQPRTFATVVARAYRKVFASYSHRDTAVVQSCETAAQATGDRYLRDVTLLRSGEQWNDRLLQAIGEADLFQLFWSENAARSPAVQTEWRQALTMQPVRGNFIRPVYWSKQVYPIPPELQAIHFERISLARLGWGKARIFLHDVFGLG